MGRKKGFTLLELLLAVQIWLIVLTYSAFLYQQISGQQKANNFYFRKLNSAQEKMEITKDLPWVEIKTDTAQGIKVVDINSSLKRVKISTENIFLETVLRKESS